MTYDYFIKMVKHHQTDRIRAFSGSQQANPEHVPTAFVLLMPEIIAVLNENLETICEPEQVMVIFGLQPATRMIASNKPLEKERFIEGLQPDYHLCCTLDFFKVAVDHMGSESWNCTDSIVIDFTSGEIMDSDQLLAKLNLDSKPGKLYGHINEDALEIAWTIAKIKQQKNSGKGFSFNDFLKQKTLAAMA